LRLSSTHFGPLTQHDLIGGFHGMLLKKIAARRFQFVDEKDDLSDRSTNRSRTSVKGKETPQNLAGTTVSDFFQQHQGTTAVRRFA
jgi:hypothetical protein